MPTVKEKDDLRTLLEILEEMSPTMGEGPYMHAQATAHEQFRALSEEEQGKARQHLSAKPELQQLISFP